MRKFIYILVAIIAFVSGSLVYYLRPSFTSISLSELRGNPTRHRLFKFKVQGDLQVYKAESKYFFELRNEKDECSVEPQCWNSLEISDEIKRKNNDLIEDLASKNQTLGKTDLRKGIYLAEVEITGKLVERPVQYNFGSDLYYEIKVEDIQQLASIRFAASDENNSSK